MQPLHIVSPEQCSQLSSQWQASARLRNEFGGRFDTFIAFVTGAVSGVIRNRSLPFELAGIFPDKPVDQPPRES